MRGRSRDISIFSVSALDLFAAALGAFILIVLILFPYYNRGGTDQSLEELEELVQRRRAAAETEQTEIAQIRILEAELQLLNRQYLTEEEKMSEIESQTEDLLAQAAAIEIPDPPPDPKPEVVEPTPVSVSRGVEFSILGIETQKKTFVIVVDMSGSMSKYAGIATNAVKEVLAQMKPDNRFLILGFQGNNQFTWFPSNRQLMAASPANIRAATDFTNQLPRRFRGGTPTQGALLQALRFNPDAIILMSDGAPEDATPDTIVRNISLRNRNSARAEIHTVAIGDYTENPQLTLFLQELARNNLGDFVGLAR